MDGGKFVSPMHQPLFTPQKHYFFFNIFGEDNFRIGLEDLCEGV
jgi:hypothetical protein